MDTERNNANNDGSAASRNMGFDQPFRERAPEEFSRSAGLDMLGELASRMKVVEESNADLRSQLNAAKSANQVEPYPGFQKHVAHVMLKHFHQDRPDVDDASKRTIG